MSVVERHPWKWLPWTCPGHPWKWVQVSLLELFVVPVKLVWGGGGGTALGEAGYKA